MGPGRSGAVRGARHGWLWSLFTFERMTTGPVIHLVYWCGLGVIVVAAFGVIGASVGIAIRDHTPETILLALPAMVGGLLIVLAGGLVWRAFCEFFVVIFRIGDDLHALRQAAEEEQAGPQR
jgi:Domain of unknown function (DUF4282)